MIDGPFHRAIQGVSPQDIHDKIIQFNSQVTKFNIDNDYKTTDWSQDEMTSTPSGFKFMGHTPTTNNLLKEGKVIKLYAIYMDNSPDEYQGGYLHTQNWKEYRIDNYGKAVGDKENHIPQWINEQGSLLIVPGWETIYLAQMISGTKKCTGYLIYGDNYK
tara:strand:+ start:1349 stop:1828 length:480 start_codon:yes stop_codon:yes gene_type:complete